MTTIAKLRQMRAREEELLKIQNSKLQKVRKIDSERQEIIKDIRKIKEARLKQRKEMAAKSNAEIQKIKRGAKKAGKAVLNYLQQFQ